VGGSDDAKGSTEEEEGRLGVLEVLEAIEGGREAGKKLAFDELGGASGRTEGDTEHADVVGRDKGNTRDGTRRGARGV